MKAITVRGYLIIGSFTGGKSKCVFIYLFMYFV